MIRTRHSPGRFRVRHAGRFSSRPTGFTLVELLVAVIIISILGSLSLAGLATARQRAKTDKTLSTIRKIDAVIRPMFDSYRTRRVSATTVAGVPNPTGGQCTRCTSGNDAAIAAWKQLVARRRLMLEEMPDCWDDVYQQSGMPSDATAAARRYAAAKQAVAAKSGSYSATYGDAEL
ncbi:MAG: type II secretion system protein, partial [Planctomycetia bacterium]